MEKVRPVILVICDYYLPGFESGGAMRTLVNMVDRLGNNLEFKIIIEKSYYLIIYIDIILYYRVRPNIII